MWTRCGYIQYRHTSNFSHTLVGNEIVDHSDVSGADPNTSSFATYHLASVDWTKTTARRDENHLAFVIWFGSYWKFGRSIACNENIGISTEFPFDAISMGLIDDKSAVVARGR